MLENPFKYTGPLDPVENKSVSILRESEIELVVNGIEIGAYWSILGPRQIGKTTFLQQIVNSQGSKNKFVEIDCEHCPDDEMDFYTWLAEEIIESLGMNKEKITLPNDKIEFSKIFLKDLSNSDCATGKIVFLFDEVDGIKFLENFLRLWRSVFIERTKKKEYKKFVVIATGSKNLIDATVGQTSPFNIAEVLRLEDFSDNECEKLFNNFKIFGNKFDEQVKNNLFREISGHPQLMQHACSIVYDMAINEEEIKERHLEMALDTLKIKNTSVQTLKSSVKKDTDLKELLIALLNGEPRIYHSFERYSFLYAGAIKEGNGGLCEIRNNLFREVLKDDFMGPGKDTSIGRNVGLTLTFFILSILFAFIGLQTESDLAMWVSICSAVLCAFFYLLKK